MSKKAVVEKGTGGHVGSIVDGMQFLPPLYFKYQTASGHCQRKPKQMKLAEGPKGSFKQRWIILHYNYIVCYKFGKNKPDFLPKPDDEPEEIIMLELNNEQGQVDASFEKGHENTFLVPTSLGTYYIECENEAEMESWISQLRTAIKGMIDVKREGIDVVTAKIDAIREELPDNTKFTSKLEDLKDAAPFTSEMVYYNDIRKKHQPYIFYLHQFAEYTIGRNKAYIGWFTERLRPAMAAADEAVVDEWTRTIKRAIQDINQSRETSFFKEDFATVLKQGDIALKTIDVYNNHMMKYHEELVPKWDNEKIELNTSLARLNTYPSMTEGDYVSQYSSGSVYAKEGQHYELWEWNQQDKTLSRTKSGAITQADSHETITFKMEDNKPCFVNSLYGIILWNNRSWIWTHPRCPFIIRFDWSYDNKLFKQHFQNIKEDRSKGKASPVPSINDWILRNNQIRAVIVGTRSAANPEPPPINLWEYKGDIPPPVAAIVVNFYAIRAITRALFGLAN